MTVAEKLMSKRKRHIHRETENENKLFFLEMNLMTRTAHSAEYILTTLKKNV